MNRRELSDHEFSDDEMFEDANSSSPFPPDSSPDSDRESVIHSEGEHMEDQDQYENSFINDNSVINLASDSEDSDESEGQIPARRPGLIAVMRPSITHRGTSFISGNVNSINSLIGKWNYNAKYNLKIKFKAARRVTGNTQFITFPPGLNLSLGLTDVPVGLSASHLRQLPKSNITQAQAIQKRKFLLRFT